MAGPACVSTSQTRHPVWKKPALFGATSLNPRWQKTTGWESSQIQFEYL
jgi:hypothetical protein